MRDDDGVALAVWILWWHDVELGALATWVGAIATFAAVAVALVVAHGARKDARDAREVTGAALDVAFFELRARLRPHLLMETEPQQDYADDDGVGYIARVTNVGNGAALLDSGQLRLGQKDITWRADIDWLGPGLTTTLRGYVETAVAPAASPRGWTGTLTVRYRDVSGDQAETLSMECRTDHVKTSVTPGPRSINESWLGQRGGMPPRSDRRGS